ncbi:MAG: glycosyltransferase [Ferruginibacter sp.]
MEKEFPNLRFVDLKGYRMVYSRSRLWLPAKLIVQFPKLLSRIYSERRWLKKTIRLHQIDAVISDNRLGLSNPNIPCIYITHQLQIKTGNRLTEKTARKIHYHFINRYKACWIPDSSGDINLAGELSHPSVLPKTPVSYLGPLSRFKKNDTKKNHDCCILLSGPEPQRSIFENILLKELAGFQGRAILVRGLPDRSQPLHFSASGIIIKDHLPAAELNEVLQQSKMIICRSGYTTIMDLVKLGQKAILVPTPGQTEQEYLAVYLQKQGLFFSVAQENFSLSKALQKANDFKYAAINLQQNGYEKIIEEFIQQIQK